jgi:predicted dinucleotide-binding enzyme
LLVFFETYAKSHPSDLTGLMTQANVKQSAVRREIAIIGATGEQGFGLALRWAQAGERILIGSRDKDKAERAAQKLRQAIDSERANVKGVENEEAVSRANTIVLTVPFAA